MDVRGKPFLRIVEQPSSQCRFRYVSESQHGKTAGVIYGETRSPSDEKRFPSVQIVGYSGPAVVVVSCVEENPPYRAHPNILQAKDGIKCKAGVCSVNIDTPDMIARFPNMGIQCVRKNEIHKWLTHREMIKVDPFKQGFRHKNDKKLDMTKMRLCFQGFLKTNQGLVALEPQVSQVIKDSKAHQTLEIMELSDNWSPSEGGKKLLLFCSKLKKEDKIEVVFSKDNVKTGQQIWRAVGAIQSIHMMSGLSVLTPPYFNAENNEIVAVHLHNTVTGDCSEPWDFWYCPSAVQQENQRAGVKREKPEESSAEDELGSGRVLGPRKLSQPSERFIGELPPSADLVHLGHKEHLGYLGHKEYHHQETSWDLDEITNKVLQSIVGVSVDDCAAPRLSAGGVNDVLDMFTDSGRIVDADGKVVEDLSANLDDLVINK